MAQVLVAGIDTSTQSTKVRVTDAATGTMVRFGQAKHPDGTSVDPECWWKAFLEASEQAGGLDDVSALSVGGQQHGMVLLDAHGEVVRDALLWNDTRSAPNAEDLIARLGAADRNADEEELDDDPQMRGRQRWVKAVGSSPVASLTITKIAWVAANEPENAAKVAAVCLPHDWLSWRIAGFGPNGEGDAHLDELFTDRSDASGTGYFDSADNDYRMDLFRMAFNRDDVILPRVAAPAEAAATADPSIAGRNVPGGCIIAAGGGDNAMASLGLNMTVGDVSISLGTSGVAAAISPVPAYDMTAAVTGFADCTGHWLPLACTINGSRIIDAGRAALGADYEELTDLALNAEAGAGGLTLIPYFDGERTPNRPDATADLHGMTLRNVSRENIARSFVEGLLCSQRDCLELIKGLGVSVNRMLLIGGGARSRAVRALAPAILGSDVSLPAADEYVAIGAARQAAWALAQSPEAPIWPLDIEETLSAPATEQVYEQYARYRG
ncbi:xylulokinase [Bifidobacterium psychraerophilum]|jgi:xylulokinase|uniref:xylulokinase n=1 Tax=Bifidobacterium psychraerophilum TaxID=218140 RepID=UPI0023F0DE2F|nr:FGGY family carbohydrate kinase [Bifidobacterium psychraerophilum]MCI1660714.1 FGGY family carbohydrate kinase [Bifidobacterium psychraerophilum]MCI1804054.1 FGGY family carbohydrate kinase [Bifidobacterium psychraerophilum]MCI2176585.1 FGGY family carbohydrate kinase [Bifidobacterium psychraerophilum]MCI2182331.1 FGGY family carbohydrate kinase [Bifidobacterium psychraerophilum]